MNAMTPLRAQTPRPISAAPDTTRTFDARDLVGLQDTARIVLDDQTYVLRVTRSGKLILTK